MSPLKATPLGARPKGLHGGRNDASRAQMLLELQGLAAAAVEQGQEYTLLEGWAEGGFEDTAQAQRHMNYALREQAGAFVHRYNGKLYLKATAHRD